ncbi:MAG: CHAT domain-containing protein [bacterium]|nr:CHAT domain-containing protein [bacterium]
MGQHLQQWEDRPVNAENVLTLGSVLSDLLFPSEVRTLLVRCLDYVQAQQAGLRIRLLLEEPLQSLPWEYALLNRGGGEATVMDFLALKPDVSFVRYQADATLPNWDIHAELPAHMIVALASPSGYSSLRLDEAQKSIEQAVGDNPHIKAHFVPEATPETIVADLRQAHLFHFIGHGGVRDGEGVIILEDGYGDSEIVNAGQLAVQLRQIGARVALLGACRSGYRDGTNSWNSVATALLKADFGAVIGMQYIILESSALAFFQAFYRALAAGLPVDEAVTNGRIAIFQKNVKDWATPVLYLRTSDGIVFPEYEADPTLEKEREQLRVSVQQQVKEVYGKLKGVKVKTMQKGTIEAKMDIGKVGKRGEVVGVEVDNMSVGTVDAEQKADTVENGGNMTGVSIDSFG